MSPIHLRIYGEYLEIGAQVYQLLCSLTLLAIAHPNGIIFSLYRQLHSYLRIYLAWQNVMKSETVVVASSIVFILHHFRDITIFTRRMAAMTVIFNRYDD